MRDELKKALGLIPDDGDSSSTSGDENQQVIHIPTVFEPKNLPTQYQDASGDKIDDYKKVRETLNELLIVSGEAMAESLDVAKDTMHPRAFEVFNNIATTVRETAKDILAIHDKMKEEQQPLIPQGANITQNNFYGSPSEILKQVRQRKQQELDNVIDADQD